jgi:hypothetical protein
LTTKLPKRVYRFRSISAMTLEALCHDQLFFASPSTFNDPLDCSPTVTADSSNAILRSVLRELMRKRLADEMADGMSRAKITRGPKADTHIKRVSSREVDLHLENVADLATDPDYGVGKEEAEQWLLMQEIERELLHQYDRGVCCFSSTYDNPLLWSHYGDQHKGICIGYGMNREPAPVLHRVLYGGNRIVSTSLIARALLEGDMPARAEVDEAMLLRKASPWRYEREWRIIDHVGLQDSCLELCDITFGLQCPEALKHMVLSALEGRETPIAFYEMRVRRDTFLLHRTKVDVDELRHYFPRTARSGMEIFGGSAD